MLYTVAGMTGLRASELALMPASFALNADTPTVTVEAAYSKHRHRDEVTLHPELRAWLADKSADAPLWSGKWAEQNSGAALIWGALEAARAAWIAEAQDEAERVNRQASEVLVYRDRTRRGRLSRPAAHVHYQPRRRGGDPVCNTLRKLCSQRF